MFGGGILPQATGLEPVPGISSTLVPAAAATAARHRWSPVTNLTYQVKSRRHSPVSLSRLNCLKDRSAGVGLTQGALMSRATPIRDRFLEITMAVYRVDPRLGQD